MIRIFSIDKRMGEREEITDLYWFEENGIHNFGGDGGGWYPDYSFEIFVNGVMVYPHEQNS